MNHVEMFMERASVFDDPLFKFEEEQHVYTYNGEPLTSATTFIKNFIMRPFDAEKVSVTYAAKRGLDPKDVLQDWADKGEYARNLGKDVHKWLEDTWSGLNPELPDDIDVRDRVKNYKAFHDAHLHDMLKPVVQEFRVFNRGKKICGTIDSVFYVSEPGELLSRLGISASKGFIESTGEYQIWDWKTNKDERFTTDDDYAWSNLKYPFNKLKDNEHNKYSIQVSFYRLILEEAAGIKTGDAFLCHIPPSGNIKVHMAKDLREEVKKHFKSKFVMESSESLF